MELYPLTFRPIFKRYIWGGRRLATWLGKPLGEGEDYAESWEICDRDPEQSLVACGPLEGTPLRTLVQQRGAELLGRHHPQPRFPLLFKYLDCHRTLSVQVHPDDALAATLVPPDLGKTEAWVVLAAEPGSVIYAGLRRGFDRQALERELQRGTCELCLHRFEPKVGDCVLIPAGTVHALGAGLLVAEIQQSSDTTWRLFDWNRLGPDGKPRPLHIEQALAAIDYQRGPVTPCTPQPTEQPNRVRLTACDKFVLDRWTVTDTVVLGGDGRCHILAVVSGAVRMPGPGLDRLSAGSTVLLPAACCRVTCQALEPAEVLDAYLP
ncbi:MAG: class I mannose-6-phosphate isomerase [Pirellulales bacterium]|nr:class I mannose-6-phosphate isomerase [Pirellulales bacterium]